MTENEKQKVAIFRFSVIHEFVGGAALSRTGKRRLMKQKCAQKWDIPFSDRTRISRSAIVRWVRLYKDSGGQLESLYPKDRSDNEGKIFSHMDPSPSKILFFSKCHSRRLSQLYESYRCLNQANIS